MGRWLILVLVLGMGVGCSPADDDDDDAIGDDDSAAVGDDDDTTAGTAGVSAAPASGDVLTWDACVMLEFDDPPSNLTVQGDANGSPVAVFLGQAEEDGLLAPLEPWPPGSALTFELAWDGGSATLQYAVASEASVSGSPVGEAAAVDLSYGHVCPDTSAISLVLPTSYHALAEVTADFGGGDVELLLGYSLASTTDQDLCIETVPGEGSWSDPLLFADIPANLYPWSGFLYPTRRSWIAVQLAPSGGPADRAAFGLVFDSEALDDLVGDDACEAMAAVNAPWCGPCPDEPAAECVYLYFHSAPSLALDTPIQPRAAADIDADPTCDE